MHTESTYNFKNKSTHNILILSDITIGEQKILSEVFSINLTDVIVHDKHRKAICLFMYFSMVIYMLIRKLKSFFNFSKKSEKQNKTKIFPTSYRISHV